MSKILITGGAGFVGSNAANVLSKEGHEVIAFDNLFLGKKENFNGVPYFSISVFTSTPLYWR